MMADSQWRRYLFLCVFTLCIFFLVMMQQPSLIIHPVVEVRVLNRGHDFTEGKTTPSTCISKGTKSNTQDKISKRMVNVNKLQRCPQAACWDFTCGIKCRNVDESLSNLVTSANNVDIYTQCGNTSMAEVTDSLYSIPFGTPCLHDVINKSCDTKFLVPNIVHYVWFSKKEMNFYHFLSFVSVLKHQKPCLIFIHGDVLPKGLYWDNLLRLADNIVHVIMSPPNEIHGRKLGRVEHQADVARLLILKEYGGIYVDTDEIILKSLDPVRIYNFTLSHALDDNLSNGLILSAPNADFISHWLDGYKTYTKIQWAYHSTILPYKLSQKFPHLLHIEYKTFVKPNYIELKQLFLSNYDWSKNYGIHLYIRFYKYQHDVISIQGLNTTMGSVSRYIIYGSKELCYS